MTRLTFDLNDPHYNVYHRAGIAGLSLTAQMWELKPKTAPQDVSFQVGRTQVTLSWNIKDVDALTNIAEASFRLTDLGVIDLPGLGFGFFQGGLKVAVHQGLMNTFFQHGKATKPDEIKTGKVVFGDPENPSAFAYKRIVKYPQQTFGDLLADKKKFSLDRIIELKQTFIPGVMCGASRIGMVAKDAIPLSYLIVSCPTYQIYCNRSIPGHIKPVREFAIVIPHVYDLTAFAERYREVMIQMEGARQIEQITSRIVSGMADATLRFRLAMSRNMTDHNTGVNGHTTVVLGRLPGDTKQMRRRSIFRTGHIDPHDNLAFFWTVDAHFGRAKVRMNKARKESFAMIDTSLADMVAMNIVYSRHYLEGFIDLFDSLQSFLDMCLWYRKGFIAMADVISNPDDKLFMEVMRAAWGARMLQLRDKEKEKNYPRYGLQNREKDRLYVEVKGWLTQPQAKNWIIQFIASVGGVAGSWKPVQANLDQFYEFMNRSTLSMLKNLVLLSIISFRFPPKAEAQPVTATPQAPAQPATEPHPVMEVATATA